MPKKIQQDCVLELAPDIYGLRDRSGKAHIYDVSELVSVDPIQAYSFYGQLQEKHIPSHAPGYVKILCPNDIDDKSIIFERQEKGWYLDRLRPLIDDDINKFLVFSQCLSKIEGYEKFRDGTEIGKSGAYFKRGLRRIFDIDESIDDRKLRGFYNAARNPQFHEGMTGQMIIIDNTNEKAIDFSNSSRFIVNSRFFYKGVYDYLESYLEELRDISREELRSCFDDIFSVL